MPKSVWKPKGIMYLVSAIVAVIAGVYIMVAVPEIWFIGVLIIVAGLVYLALAYRNKEKVPEEHEKPLMKISTKADAENKKDD